MATGNKVFFDKLNGENYFTWKYRMEHFLKKEKLWKVISTTAPTATNNNMDQMSDWNENDEQALAWLICLIDDSQLCYVRNKKTAAEAWQALKNQYEKATLTNKVTVMRRICGKRLNEGENVEQHIAEITDLFQKLVDLGDEIRDGWKVSMLFTSLPTSYDPLITALESRAEEDITFSMAQQKLVAEYKRRCEKDGTNTMDSALRTTNSSKGGKI